MSRDDTPSTFATLGCATCGEDTLHARAWCASVYACEVCGKEAPRPVAPVSMDDMVEAAQTGRGPVAAGTMSVMASRDGVAWTDISKTVLQHPVITSQAQADEMFGPGFIVLESIGKAPDPIAVELSADPKTVIDTLALRIQDLERQLEARDDRDTENAGLLANLCDIAFDDELRAANHGYEGIEDHVRWLLSVQKEAARQQTEERKKKA